MTPVLDLSTVYEYNELSIIDKIRTYSKGLLKVEIENDKIFPPSHQSEDPVINTCLLNQLPREKRCHLYTSNTVVGTNVLTILFYRQHNYIAKMLAQMNPCWSDDKLFYTAKDINIAIYSQIYYCEVLPILLGRDNLIKEGLSCPEGFRDMYDDNVVPEVSDEYVYINRWFHTIQNADIKLYDKHGYFLNSMVVTNITLRTGWLPLDNNLDKIFQGSFRHPGAKVDHIIDPELGQDGLQGINFASDIATNDLEKGRLFGFPPYVKYREFCAKKPYKTFASLSDVMNEERIHRLTQLYDNVEDVDLMAGVWSEDKIPGGMVPYTVYCLLMEQVKRTIAMDRHWYERPNRPHAFTLDQLKAIRKATIAGVMCTNADGVTKIQRNAFKTISTNNPLTDCKFPKMGKVDLSAWQDPQCKK